MSILSDYCDYILRHPGLSTNYTLLTHTPTQTQGWVPSWQRTNHIPLHSENRPFFPLNPSFFPFSILSSSSKLISPDYRFARTAFPSTHFLQQRRLGPRTYLGVASSLLASLLLVSSAPKSAFLPASTSGYCSPLQMPRKSSLSRLQNMMPPRSCSRTYSA